MTPAALRVLRPASIAEGDSRVVAGGTALQLDWAKACRDRHADSSISAASVD